MQKINLVIFLIITCLFLTGCNKKLSSFEKLKMKDEIVVGVKEDSPPFGFIKNNERTGLDIDVANLVFSKLFEYDNKKIVFKSVTAQDKIMKLNSGEIDFIVAVMSITPQRKEVVSFSLPYFVAGQTLMIREGSLIKSIEDLNDREVSVVIGTTGEKVLRKLAPYAIIKGAKTYNEAFKMLKNSDVQAICGDDSILYGLLLKEKGYKILNTKYTKEYYAIAYRKEKNNSELTRRLDAVISEIQTNGELNKIKYKWVPKAHLAN